MCAFFSMRKRLEFVWIVSLVVFGLGLASGPAQAGRTVVIDNNTDEVWSDAENAQIVPLSFPVNYGSGLQSNVSVQLPLAFSSSGFAAVGLTFTGSPSDILFATVAGGGSGIPQVPGLRMSNPTETSTPANPVDDASIFNFGTVTNADMAPPPPGSPLCEVSSGGIRMCYGPITNYASFQFVDESSSGNPGDFELILQCTSGCGNIGFNLGGFNFSADDFNPNAPLPPQLVSYSLGNQNQLFHPGTWTFLFRNPSSVPEPGTWGYMLAGFALIGTVLRRQRKRKVQLG